MARALAYASEEFFDFEPADRVILAQFGPSGNGPPITVRGAPQVKWDVVGYSEVSGPLSCTFAANVYPDQMPDGMVECEGGRSGRLGRW